MFIARRQSDDTDGDVVGADEYDARCTQVLVNVHAAPCCAGADQLNVVQFITYMEHSQSITEYMAVRQCKFPMMFHDGKCPRNALLPVDRLV